MVKFGTLGAWVLRYSSRSVDLKCVDTSGYISMSADNISVCIMRLVAAALYGGSSPKPNGKSKLSPGTLNPSNTIPSLSVPLQCLIMSLLLTPIFCSSPILEMKCELRGTSASPTPIGLLSSGKYQVICLSG